MAEGAPIDGSLKGACEILRGFRARSVTSEGESILLVTSMLQTAAGGLTSLGNSEPDDEWGAQLQANASHLGDAARTYVDTASGGSGLDPDTRAFLLAEEIPWLLPRLFELGTFLFSELNTRAPVAAAGGSHRAPSRDDLIFVSYARPDREFALSLSNDLRSKGLTVWLDQWSIGAGAEWDAEIDRGIERSRAMVVVLSPSSIESAEVRAEWRAALDQGKRVIPVIHRGSEIPRRLRVTQWVDFSDASSSSSALSRLVQALRDE